MLQEMLGRRVFDVKHALIAVVEYVLGFFALAVFAAYAFAHGTPSEARWISAFKLGGCLAALELLVLWRRKPIANRLVVGANLWLLVGGAAALTQQWWVLEDYYQHFGEASLFAAMLGVGVVSTFVLPGGFVAVLGPRRKVLVASMVLLVAVLAALFVAVVYRGDTRIAAVLPVIALSWLNRGLRRFARDGS